MRFPKKSVLAAAAAALLLLFLPAVPCRAGELLSLEESGQLFAYLSGSQLTASSGAGAWEGGLSIEADGRFRGYYYDEDAEELHEVVFSGSFNPAAAERRGEHSYSLWVEELSARNTPGTEETGDDGIRIVYDQPPFRSHEYLYLTLPGTPDGEIPEMVMGEIGGTYDQWEDFSHYITLTRPEDGWGFFAEATRPFGENPEPTAASSPTPAVTETPSGGEGQPGPAETSAPGPEDSAASWEGYWTTRDDSMSELVITPNGDGTLHVLSSFLRTMDLEAELTPQADGSMRYVSVYEAYIGSLTQRGDGTLRLVMTGGYAYEDDEATEYQAYFSREFIYYPAAYEDLWYEDPSEPPVSEEDWLGDWAVQRGSRWSDLHIERRNGGLYLRVSFDGLYTFSGRLEKSGDKIMDYFGDEFNCMLTLNRKRGAIIMEEDGSSVDAVYDWLEDVYYGILEYTRAEPDDTDANKPGTEPTPAPAAGEIPADLLPVPGSSGWMQVPIGRVNASSYIIGKDPTAFIPDRMIDGNEQTAWQFSTKTSRLPDACVWFQFDGPVRIDAVWIRNGYWKTSGGHDQYTRNCRVKELEVTFQYNGRSDYTDPVTITLKDDKKRQDWQKTDFGPHEGVIGIRFRIMSIYKGTKYKSDVCISDVMFVQQGPV